MALPVVLYGRGSPLSPNAPTEPFSNYSSPGHARDASAPCPNLGMAAAQDSVVVVQVGPQFFSPTVILCCTSRQRIRLAERGYSALARRGRWRDIGDEDPYHCGLKC